MSDSAVSGPGADSCSTADGVVSGAPDAGDSCSVPDSGSLSGGGDVDDWGAPDDDGFGTDSDPDLWADGGGGVYAPSVAKKSNVASAVIPV